MKAVAALLGIVPGWLYALIVAALVLTNCASHTRLQRAQTAEAQAREETARLRADHATALGAETAKVLAAERALNVAVQAQEKKDAAAKETIADLRAGLRANSRAAGGAGLRDPFAAGCRDATAHPGAAGAGPGADDTGQIGRLVSVELEEFLLQQASEADDINAAYASCREDAMSVRQILNSQVSPHRPSDGPASPAAP